MHCVIVVDELTGKRSYHTAGPERHRATSEQPKSTYERCLERLCATSAQDPVPYECRTDQVPHPVCAVESKRFACRKVENVFDLRVQRPQQTIRETPGKEQDRNCGDEDERG